MSIIQGAIPEVIWNKNCQKRRSSFLAFPGLYLWNDKRKKTRKMSPNLNECSKWPRPGSIHSLLHLQIKHVDCKCSSSSFTEVAAITISGNNVDHQYSETKWMHFLFSLLSIEGLYMFRALLSHPQEGLHKRHFAYCVRVMSAGCTRIGVEVGVANWHNKHAVYQVPFV
jgi:hypothetical protein